MDIIVGDRYHVKVVAVKERLVVVEFEDSSTSIIHISKIANCFVKDINDFIAVGDELIAEAIKSDEKPFELSLKHLKTVEQCTQSEKQQSFTDQLDVCLLILLNRLAIRCSLTSMVL